MITIEDLKEKGIAVLGGGIMGSGIGSCALKAGYPVTIREISDEKCDAARDAIAQILVNSRMCAINKRPLCQDTGIVTVFVKIGAKCSFDTGQSIQDMVDDQYVGIVVKYIKDHPEKLHIDGLTLVFSSYIEAFPCK